MLCSISATTAGSSLFLHLMFARLHVDMHAWHAGKHTRTLTCWPLSPRPSSLCLPLSCIQVPLDDAGAIRQAQGRTSYTLCPHCGSSWYAEYARMCVCVCVCVCVRARARARVHVFMNLCVYALCMHMYVNLFAQVWSHKDSILSD